MKGVGASEGIAIGQAVVLGEAELKIPQHKVDDIEAEQALLHAAIDALSIETQEMHDSVLEMAGEKEAEIIDAYLMILQDHALIAGTLNRIIQGQNVVNAAKEGLDEVLDLFRQMDDEYICQRIEDVQDIQTRLLYRLLGIASPDLSSLPQGSIIVAKELTVSMTAKMDFRNVKGFLTELGGVTSHTSILARSLEIPAVVGAKGIMSRVNNGDLVAIDGSVGNITVNPAPDKLELLHQKIAQQMEYRTMVGFFKNKEGKTADDLAVQVSANIGTPAEMTKVLEYGAQGVGLFRSEFLYLDQKQLPDEEFQFAAYKNVVEKMKGKPVTVRTLDVGGDKELPCLELPQEENPFLGYRAIRVCLSRSGLFQTQLRALLRAGLYGDLRIMFPMISSLEELREAKGALEVAKQELAAKGVPFQQNCKVGMMVEVPAAAMLADKFAKECDFFSIGTNDLIQYTVAVDRGNEQVSSLYSPYHPAVIRLVGQVLSSADEAGIPCGMCGEAAADIRLLPAWLALGLRDFSVSGGSILDLKYALSKITTHNLKEIRQEILNLGTTGEVKSYLSSLSHH